MQTWTHTHTHTFQPHTHAYGNTLSQSFSVSQCTLQPYTQQAHTFGGSSTRVITQCLHCGINCSSAVVYTEHPTYLSIAHTDTHTHTHTHKHTRTDGRTHAHTHTHGWMDGHTHTHTHGRMEGHTHTHTHTNTHTHTDRDTHTHTHTHKHTHTHTHGRIDGHTHTHHSHDYTVLSSLGCQEPHVRIPTMGRLPTKSPMHASPLHPRCGVCMCDWASTTWGCQGREPQQCHAPQHVPTSPGRRNTYTKMGLLLAREDLPKMMITVQCNLLFTISFPRWLTEYCRDGSPHLGLCPSNTLQSSDKIIHMYHHRHLIVIKLWIN